MSSSDDWKRVEERIAEAYRRGEDPDPDDLLIREEHEKEWEISYPISAGLMP
jgi:hypothetical protein